METINTSSALRLNNNSACSNRVWIFAWVIWMLMLVPGLSIPPAISQTDDPDTYAAVAPILTERCIMCHSGDAAPLGLRLDTFDSVLKGSTRGPVVKAGDTAGSELIRRLKGISQPRMPMTGPPFLSDAEIATFESWVNSGLREGEVTEAKQPEKELISRPAPGEMVTYQYVAPIFAIRCAKCHAEKGLMGSAPEGLRLTSYESTISIAHRARVVPGNSNASELVRRIRGQARPRMPFDGPPYLTSDEIQLIEQWIDQGARDAEGNAATIPAGASVRLHGTLTRRWQLDGLELDVNSGTRIDKSPRRGDYVQVRGRLDENGKLRVKRIRRR